MKTYKKLSNEIDEVLGISARRAVGRRMKILARKASVKMAKLRNARKSMPTNVDAKAHKQDQWQTQSSAKDKKKRSNDT